MSAELTTRLKSAARELGFVLSGVCNAATPDRWDQFGEWLAAGYGGELDYLETRRAAYAHPRHVLPEVRSLLMLAFPYRAAEPVAMEAGCGKVSRYAWNDQDYHDLIHERLKRLARQLKEWCPAAKVRGVIDTAPLLERDFARRAGLGWIGKNTLLIHRGEGSWFFLAALLTDVELVADAPFTADHCGSCRACLDACPTNAFVSPYVLDARRCLSYLTIELRGSVPSELREGLGDWVFGCDVCQEVCPWNRKAPAQPDGPFRPAEGMNPLDLLALFELDEAAFRARFRETALWRTRRRGLLRNAALVLGNQRHLPAVPALIQGLQDSEPIVRGACAWALGRMGTAEARQFLAQRLAMESDEEVRRELQQGLTAAAGNEPATS